MRRSPTTLSHRFRFALAATVIALGWTLADAALSLAQPVDIPLVEWIERPPGEAMAVAADASGIYVASLAFVATLERDVTVQRFDPDGSLRWTHTLPDGAELEIATAIAVHASGVYVAGLRGTWLNRGCEAFVAKLDREGNHLWTLAFTTCEVLVGSNDPNDLALAVDDTGVYVAGTTQLFALPGQVSLGRRDAFLRKLDHQGSEVWTRQFGTPEDDELFALAVHEGLVVVTGETFGVADPDAGRESLVRAYDAEGRVLWTDQFGRFDRATAVAVDASGVYVGGNNTGNAGRIDPCGCWAYLLHYTPTGALVWQENIQAPFGLDAPTVTGIAVRDEDVTVVGEAFEGIKFGLLKTAFLYQYDLEGTLLWQRQIGVPLSEDFSRDIAADSRAIYALGLGGQLFEESEPTPFSSVLLKIDDDPARVSVDIRPGTCSAPLDVTYHPKRNKQGVVTVAIAGTEELPVAEIHPESIRLAGVAPLRWHLADEIAPREPFYHRTLEDCYPTSADGLEDLVLKFSETDLAEATRLLLGSYRGGEEIFLPLEANEFTGSPTVVGEDAVRIQVSRPRLVFPTNALALPLYLAAVETETGWTLISDYQIESRVLDDRYGLHLTLEESPRRDGEEPLFLEKRLPVLEAELLFEGDKFAYLSIDWGGEVFPQPLNSVEVCSQVYSVGGTGQQKLLGDRICSSVWFDPPSEFYRR
jgi:outer membrane protein assembly factor BamB